MRLLGSLAVLSVLALGAPAIAQDANQPAPAAGTEAPAAAPAVRTPNPAGISDVADRTLWCGHAFVEASSQVKESGDVQGADAMVRDGNDLIAKGAAMLAEAGFDAGRIDAAKADYAAQAKAQLVGDGAGARYAYDECLVLTPAGAKLLGGQPAQSAPGGAAPAAAPEPAPSN